MMVVRTPWLTRRYPTAVRLFPHGYSVDLIDGQDLTVASVSVYAGAIIEDSSLVVPPPPPTILTRFRRALGLAALTLLVLAAGCDRRESPSAAAPDAPEPLSSAGTEPETLIVPPGALDVVRLGIAVQACPMLEQFICNDPYPPEFFDFIYYTGAIPPGQPESWRVHWAADTPPPDADFWNYFLQWASLPRSAREALCDSLRAHDILP